MNLYYLNTQISLMIKLKLTGKEMKAICVFFQNCISIARAEINGGFEYEVYRMEGNTTTREVSWQTNHAIRTLKVAERHAQIDEFEKAQRKILLSFNIKNQSKAKAVSITKSTGYFFLQYMAKAEATEKEAYINFVMQAQSNTILKNLL